MFNDVASPDNGRVDTVKNDNYDLYKLYRENRPYKNANYEAIKSIHNKNEVSEVFFSRQNIDYLHEAIRYMVYEKSCKKHVIDRQSETDLLIIMRSIYLQYGEFKAYNIREQVRELNSIVLEYCVPKILEEIRLYMHYRKDISQLPVPMERGEFVSSKGTKVLEQNF